MDLKKEDLYPWETHKKPKFRCSLTMLYPPQGRNTLRWFPTRSPLSLFLSYILKSFSPLRTDFLSPGGRNTFKWSPMGSQIESLSVLYLPLRKSFLISKTPSRRGLFGSPKFFIWRVDGCALFCSLNLVIIKNCGDPKRPLLEGVFEIKKKISGEDIRPKETQFGTP